MHDRCPPPLSPSALPKLPPATEQDAPGSGSAKPGATASPPGRVVRRPEVVDDFLRNFFAKAGLSRTAEAFEAEWYELKATGRLQAGATTMPDVYLRNSVSPGASTL